MFKIVVVDDEPDLRYILRRLLEQDGHEVVDAGNGAAALEAIQRSAPDLVITDLMMPVMGGAELIRRLRADPGTAGIPILAMTSNAQLAVGADIILTKLWNQEEVRTAANDLLTRHGMNVEPSRRQ